MGCREGDAQLQQSQVATVFLLLVPECVIPSPRRPEQDTASLVVWQSSLSSNRVPLHLPRSGCQSPGQYS